MDLQMDMNSFVRSLLMSSGATFRVSAARTGADRSGWEGVFSSAQAGTEKIRYNQPDNKLPTKQGGNLYK